MSNILKYRIVIFCFMLLCIHASGQNIFPATGKVGIGTTTPATLLQVKGGSRFGSLTNFANIDTGGNLFFTGTAAYKVSGNKYVFRYTGTQGYSLFFNLTNTRYDLRDSNGAATAMFGANDGNASFKGGVKVGNSTAAIAGNIRWNGTDFQGYTGTAWKSLTTGTVYVAGTGISISGNSIKNTVPDKVVTITSSNGVSVTGAYPNFAIGNIATPWFVTGNVGTDTSLNFIGTIDARPLLVKVNSTTAGELDTFGNVHLGISAGLLSTGYSNVAVGRNALQVYKGGELVAVGVNSLANDVSGIWNTGVGSFTLKSHRTGSLNTAVGYAALNDDTSGYQNTSVGAWALRSNISGFQNTSVGSLALYLNTVGTNNTATGSASLFNNRTGSFNSAFGNATMDSNLNGNYNTAVGGGALYYNSSGNSNVAVGINALFNNRMGNNLVAIGDSALFNDNETNSFNTAVGSKALYANTTGYYNTATGYRALFSNSSGIRNTANGLYALFNNTAGSNNTATGTYALESNTTGSGNVANGVGALQANTEGNYNSAYGLNSLYTNTTGIENTASGYGALYSNQDGSDNAAFGKYALYTNTDGSFNTALGWNAMFFDINGSNNTATGGAALQNNTSGSYNSAFGINALYSNNGSQNTATGGNALWNTTSGLDNTGTGFSALGNNTTGSYNTANGFEALITNATGSFNTAVGYYADVVGDQSNATAIGYNARANFSNECVIGNANVTLIGGAAGWSTLSDGRFKKNIETNVPGLNFIKQLRPVTYTLDIKGINSLHTTGKQDQKTPGIQTNDDNALQKNAGKNIEEEAIKQKESIVYTGLIAQEVEGAANKTGFNFSGIHKPQNDHDNYSLDYSSFVMPLIKSVQELSKMNDAKDATLDTLKKENADLRKENGDLKTQFAELRTLVLSIQQKQEQCSPCSAAGVGTQTHNTTITDGALLEQNTPNPFTHTTTISYTLPQRFTTAQIMITDKNGKTLKLVNVSGSGKGSVNVDASVLAAGAYNYSLLVDGKLVGTKQMVLAR